MISVALHPIFLYISVHILDISHKHQSTRPKPGTIAHLTTPFGIMEPSSSQSNGKGKGRAPEYAHLPAYGGHGVEDHEEYFPMMDWASTEALMPPLERVRSHSDDAPDNRGGLEQHQTPFQHRMTVTVQEMTGTGSDGTEDPGQILSDADRDTELLEPPKKKRIAFPDNLPSPPPRHPGRLHFEEPPPYRPRDRTLEDDIDAELVFQPAPAPVSAPAPTCPPSPRPRHRELHPSHVPIGEGNLRLQNILVEEVELEHVEEFEAVDEAQEVEYSEESDEDEPLIDYRSLRVCAGNFYLMGHFDTRLSRRTWDPCTSRHIIQHPSTTVMFRTCFLEQLPALYQRTLERHRGQ